MRVINARNVNDAYATAIDMFRDDERTDTLWKMPSRAGDVRELDHPVTTCFHSPHERVLWDAKRDCNPFLHLFESLWMLAGRRDVAYLTQFVKKFKDFSDDGEDFYGAYGARWRKHFQRDQIIEAVSMLQADKMTRRCFIGMWDPNADLWMESKDIPCNVGIKFEARKDRLDMIVFNRSNDMIWGAYGANAVHMSFLQEFIASRLEIPIGYYWQVSGNFHVYDAVWEDKVRPDGSVDEDLYGLNRQDERTPQITPLVSRMPEGFKMSARGQLECIESFVSTGETSPYLNGPTGAGSLIHDVAAPLMKCWNAWKDDRGRGYFMIKQLPNQRNDWIMACRLWMERRLAK